MALIPTVIEKNMDGERAFDVYSYMLRNRIVFCNGEVEDNMAQSIVAQLLLLEAEDPNKDITMYISSPGGSILAGNSIISTMDYIKCDIRTIVTGYAASMGAVIASSGTIGKRMALPLAEVMVHCASSGVSGKVHDMVRSVEHTQRLNDQLIKRMAERSCGKISEAELADICRYDTWWTAQEAIDHGIIDEIVKINN